MVLTHGAFVNLRSRKGFWYSRSCKGGGRRPPPDISKNTYAFGPETGLVLDRSNKGEYTKKQNEKLKGSVKIWYFFKILCLVWGRSCRTSHISPSYNHARWTKKRKTNTLSCWISFLLMGRTKHHEQVVSKLSISCRFFEMTPKITKSQIVQDFILNVKNAPLEFSHTSESIKEKLYRFSIY